MFFPITKDPKIKFEVIEKTLQKKKKRLSYEDELEKILTPTQLLILPKSYDLVGSIAILEIPDELYKKDIKVAEALIKTQPHIETVLRKDGIHSGKFRTQKLKFLSGKRTKIASHKENNAIIKLNVEKVYFSTRSANERKRVAQKIKPNENILVMFSGAAPFPMVLDKNSQAKHIVGIELNPEGHKYGLENTTTNKLTNVELINGDVNKVIPKMRRKFDRIFMPLPKIADEFLHLALKVSKKDTIIHLYKFLSEDEYQSMKKRVKQICKENKKSCRIQRIVKCGNYSPGVNRTCLDIKIV